MSFPTHFSADWFTGHADEWLKRLASLIDTPAQGLEVGSYEGRSAHWILENILTHSGARLTCVDSWDGSDKTLGQQTLSAREVFKRNLRPHLATGRVIQRVGPDIDILPEMIRLGERFDMIFVDADHEGESALLDLLMCWRLLKVGGYLVFDDYRWEHPALRSQPKDAWEAFLMVKPWGLEWEIGGRMVFATKGRKEQES